MGNKYFFTTCSLRAFIQLQIAFYSFLILQTILKIYMVKNEEYFRFLIKIYLFLSFLFQIAQIFKKNLRITKLKLINWVGVTFARAKKIAQRQFYTRGLICTV